MPRQPTHEEKTLRAFRAYIELLDAAEWFKSEVRAPLAAFDLTINEFLVLELLNREGAQFATQLAKKQNESRRQWTDELVGRLEKRGWVARKLVELPPVEFERMHWPASMRDEPREGRRGCRGGADEIGKEVLPQRPPASLEARESLHAHAQWHRTGILGKALPQIVRGRHSEICPRDQDREEPED